MVCLDGRLRNLSRGGLGFLVRRTFSAGEPIEVEVIPPINSKVHLGGLVRFCRYVGSGYYEVGMEFMCVSSWPLFTDDVKLAKHHATEWQERDVQRGQQSGDEPGQC